MYAVHERLMTFEVAGTTFYDMCYKWVLLTLRHCINDFSNFSEYEKEIISSSIYEIQSESCSSLDLSIDQNSNAKFFITAFDVLILVYDNHILVSFILLSWILRFTQQCRRSSRIHGIVFLFFNIRNNKRNAMNGLKIRLIQFSERKEVQITFHIFWTPP